MSAVFCSPIRFLKSLAFSVILHGLVVFLADPLPDLSLGKHMGDGRAVLSATLALSSSSVSRTVDGSPRLPPSEFLLEGQGPITRQSVAVLSDKSIFIAPDNADSAANHQSQDALVKSYGQPDKTAVFPQAESVNSDGIRQYRLSLGREARRYKDFPRLAREQGWEGEVIVVVSTVAGIAQPQVSLSQSSEYGVLDAGALEIIRQAVRSAALPESLYGKVFALTLPVRFSLED